ncbi:MAG: hypothetical protein HYY09_08840 [Firmicutes bacterium]|nr:hypothetical protein [Bacillota bacterium]
MPSKLKSRKLWMAVVNGLLIIANEGLDLGLPEAAVRTVTFTVIAYILAEAGTDIARTRRTASA